MGEEEFLQQKRDKAKELRLRQKQEKQAAEAAAAAAQATAQEAAAHASVQQLDVVARLAKLAELWSQGALDDTEFKVAKAQVLGLGSPSAATAAADAMEADDEGEVAAAVAAPQATTAAAAQAGHDGDDDTYIAAVCAAARKQCASAHGLRSGAWRWVLRCPWGTAVCGTLGAVTLGWARTWTVVRRRGHRSAASATWVSGWAAKSIVEKILQVLNILRNKIAQPWCIVHLATTIYILSGLRSHRPAHRIHS